LWPGAEIVGFVMRRPVILFYNDFFDRVPRFAEAACAGEFDFTRDRSRIVQADAVVFHLPWFKENLSTLAKYPRNLWVAWSKESKDYVPILADARAMASFEIKMTYERSAEIWFPYLPKLADVSALRERAIPQKSEEAPLVLFQSSKLDKSGRYEFATEVMTHVRTDSYGKQLNNRTFEGPDEGWSTKFALIARYKFCLAIENSIAPDYVTEKFFDPLLAGTVPVYRGAPNIEDFAPGPKSFINAADFSGPRELAEYLNYLDRDDAAYREYFAWRSDPSPIFLDAVRSVEEDIFCRLGRLVSERIVDRRFPFGQEARANFPLLWLEFADGRIGGFGKRV
jgi:hypothetical protein